MQLKPIPQALLDEVNYDPTSPTGLRWRRPGRGRRRDLQCGTVNPGDYARVSYDRKMYLAHRVVWALHNGDPAEQTIDHIDLDTNNNAIENLQLVSRAENLTRRTGKGYYQRPSGLWTAQVVDGRAHRYLGTFATEAEARAAYVEAKAKLTEGLNVTL